MKLCPPTAEGGGEKYAQHPSEEVKPRVGMTGLVSECQEWPEAAVGSDTREDERGKEGCKEEKKKEAKQRGV